MVKKAKPQKPKQPKNTTFVPPENWTGYPSKKPGNSPAEIAGKTMGGGKRAS